MKSAEYKELAAQKFAEAHALEQGEEGSVAAEDQAKYEALITEGLEAETQAGQAAKAEGLQETARDRFAFYHGKGTGGSQMRWQAIGADPDAGKTLGQAFIDSEAYDRLVKSGALTSGNSSFRSEPVSAPGFMTPRGLVRMGAATSDVINTDPSGGNVVGPQARRLPGVYALGTPPLVIRDLFPNESIDVDSIEYVKQTSRDLATGLAVKESTSASDSAGLKKQSSAGLEIATARSEILATWFAATRKSLQQRIALRSFIDNQGRLALASEEDDQFLNGDGTSPNLSGLLDQDERLHLDISALGGMDNLDALRRAKRLIKQGASRLPANWVILNPADSEGFDLLKNGIDDYRGGNPIGGGFGEGELPIWRLRRVESESIDEGVALVGSGVAATVFQRQPVQVLVADQHSDFFVRNLVVILFEEEVAFPVYFPTAICEVKLEDFGIGS